MMRRNVPAILHKLPYAVSLVVLGYLSGKYINIPGYQFETNINGVELLSLAANTALAVYVAKVITRNQEVSRTGKEIVTRKLDRIIDQIELLRGKISSGSFYYQDAVSFRKRLSLSIKRVCHLHDQLQGFGVEYEKSAVRTLGVIHGLLTDDNRTQQQQNTGEAPLRIKHGRVTYTTQRITEIMLAMDELVDNILALQLAVIAHSGRASTFLNAEH